MKMYVCPNCGSISPRETRQCPKLNRKPVCIRCCHECTLYDPDPQSSWTCRYYIEYHHMYHAPERPTEAHRYVDECRKIIERKHKNETT